MSDRNEEILGIGLEPEVETQKEETAKEAVSFDRKKMRAPWFEWEVGNESYKLKLTTENILKVEKKYKTNILNLLSVDGMPSLSVMLTIIQAAMLKYQHGIKIDDLTAIYDRYVDCGGGQTGLLKDVIMPTMMVSGFFTQSEEKNVEGQMDEEDLM
ncbi:MAG: DUF6096 family protein [Eubacteriales bacterium]|nr:DUF6096 family protein [Eubacteriales bacterium]